jgi:hypothetical protein
MKESVFSVRQQIRLRPDQIEWLEAQREQKSQVIRRLIDAEMERKKGSNFPGQ